MSDMDLVKKVVEGALLVAGRPLSIDQLLHLFGDEEGRPARDEVKATLEDLDTDCANKGYELKRVASGYRLQVREDMAPWVSRLWDEKPPKYSRALLETLSIIAYRQPITRGDIEHIRGVAVSSNIVRSLLEREWVRVVGHRDVPGKPALYATTRLFLDYFNLTRLGDLPPLSEIKDLADINPELALEVEAEQAELEKLAAAEAADIEANAETEGNDESSEADTDGRTEEQMDEIPVSYEEASAEENQEDDQEDESSPGESVH
jgi:segregation and condensation protein B